jgi:outer membrane protein W
MRKLALITGLLLLTFCSTGFSQDEEEKDFLEASLFAGLVAPTGGISNWSDSLGAKSGFSAGFDIGYFLTPSIVLGLTFSYAQMPIDAVDEASQLHHRFYNPAVYGKYYFFSESHFAPYFKAQAGVDNAKFTTSVYDQNGAQPKYREMSYDPAFAIGGGAGLFYYTSDVSGFYVEANVHHAFSESAKGTYQNNSYEFGESSTFFDLHAGLSLFFGSSK